MSEATVTPGSVMERPLGASSARVTGFLRMLQRLDESDWLEVCRRHLADEPSLRAAADFVNQRLRSDDDPHERSWRMQEVTSAYVDVSRALARLPATLEDGGKSLPCRGIALLAASNAVRALVMEPQLKNDPVGKAAVRDLVAVFGEKVETIPGRHAD